VVSPFFLFLDGDAGAGSPGVATPEATVGTLARVYIHDGAGRRIGELTTTHNIDRAYVLMEPASARFMVSVDEPLLHELDPREGRMVVIESDRYPYPWVGKLTGLGWQREDPAVTATCRSLDAVLTQRFVNGTYSGSAGLVFAKVLEDAAASNPTGIAPGTIAPGPPYAAVLQDRSAFQALNLIAQQTGYEWWVEYDVSPAQVLTYANFRPARGFDRASTHGLIDGGNADWTACKIEGETAFALTVVGGQGSTTQTYSERPRHTEGIVVGSVHGHSLRRTLSQAYGITRIERIRLAENLKSRDLVQDAAQAMMSRWPTPEQAMEWVVWDVDNHGAQVDWTGFDVGSVIHASAPTAFITGFTGALRIVGVQPSEELGLLRLVVEIVEESYA
jgi:hypothetical protein